MEDDLNRSLRLLEDALTVQNKSPFRSGPGLGAGRLLRKKDFTRDANLSHTLPPTELEDTYKLERESSNFINLIDTDKTLTGSVIRAHQPWKNTFDTLYLEYLEILQSHSNSQEVLETVCDLANCCADTLNVARGLKSKVMVKYVDEIEDWIENERNTWRLVYVLYQDRLSTQCLEEGTNENNQYFGLSEKLCMLNLFKRDSIVRESQLVVDWLESNAAEKDDELLHFTDSTVGWENTLHQLQSRETIVFESSREIVTRMDPDAPVYQKKPLHDLDIEDEKRLCRRMFQEIRCGKLVEAQKLATHSGHAWRAVLLEGWKLHHDPNIENDNAIMDVDDLNQGDGSGPIVDVYSIKETEGNEIRDIWKIMALKFCDEISLDVYEKAAVAAYCGYLKTLLPVCKTWEDYLWAYMRVMVDIRVESEIRDCLTLTYKPLPDFYWDQKMSINEIFTALESSKEITIRSESSKPIRVIQKYLVLDQIHQLFEAIEDWINDDISNHFLRFVTHLVLFLEQVGQVPKREVVEKVLEAYIKCLMEMHETQLVAFYVSKTSPHMQISLYSTYLEAITEEDKRRESLRFAEDCGLNVQLLTKTVVENIRNRPHETGESGLQERITSSDEFKISSVNWLLFYESHLPEALIQSNALIFAFLTMRKIDAAQLVFNKIPPASVEKIMAEGAVPEDIEKAIREHLSYKSYLDAQEAFSLWFKHFKSKPATPENIPENAHLTEKVAHQHRMSQFKAETERWKLTIAHLAKSAKTLLYNVLLFPNGGWLHGADFLRSSCIPECVLLLYTVLFESKLYNECMQLADILASEKYSLYKVYSKEKLSEIIGKLTETSVALLNEKMDPWGSSTS